MLSKSSSRRILNDETSLSPSLPLSLYRSIALYRYAFQEQQSEDTKVMLDGVAAVVNSFRERIKPYLPQV
jgi:hypothetical protein